MRNEDPSASSEMVERFGWKYLQEPYRGAVVWKDFPRDLVKKLWCKPKIKHIMVPYTLVSSEPHRIKGVLPKQVRFAVLENHVISGYPDSLLSSKKFNIGIHIRRTGLED